MKLNVCTNRWKRGKCVRWRTVIWIRKRKCKNLSLLETAAFFLGSETCRRIFPWSSFAQDPPRFPVAWTRTRSGPYYAYATSKLIVSLRKYRPSYYFFKYFLLFIFKLFPFRRDAWRPVVRYDLQFHYGSFHTIIFICTCINMCTIVYTWVIYFFKPQQRSQRNKSTPSSRSRSRSSLIPPR